jgi:hypothetical protein
MVQPLQLPGPLVVPSVDWSGLNQIGDALMRKGERQREAEAFGGLVEAIPTRGEPPQTAPGGQPGGPPSGPSGGVLPRGLRNNNPGNIEDGPLAKSLPGYKGPAPDDPRYATFETPEHGLGAMDALLTSYGRRGLKTVGEVIGRWAPKGPKDPNNDPDAYARFVSPTGDPNAPIDLSDPVQRKQLIGKMAIFENGLHAGAPREGERPPGGVAQPTAADVIAAQRGMPADMKKRVKALFAVGTPAATQVALGLVSKFIGKQEPIKLGEGDVLIDPDTGKIVGRAPGKSQSVREGGALVQDGKVVYQAPDRPQNVAPGSTLVQGGKPVYQAAGHAKLQEVELPDGTKIPVIFDEQTRQIRALKPEELQSVQRTGDLPPEVSPKIVKKERSEALVANEQSAVASAKAAADLKPLIDQAAISYERAQKAGGIGAIVGSPAGRMGAKYVWGGEAEKARQEYDKAIAAVQARITAAQNRGQGAVSDFERKLYAMQFPDLQAASPEEQIAFLRELQAATDQTIKAGGSSMLGRQPSVVLDRPPVASTKDQAKVPATPQPPLARFGTPEFDALPPGAPYIAPDGKTRLKRVQ